MPYCEVGRDQNVAVLVNDDDAAKLNSRIRLFYRTYGCGPTKVLLIIGLAGTHDSWGPQIKGLTGTDRPNDDETMTGDWNKSGGGGIEVCAFDNRGMGRSSVPMKNSDYTTKIMAKDSIALLDHLGWKKAHVFGHSMGAMIACKVAAMVPDRVLSLALLNVTGGGFECFPRVQNRPTQYQGPALLDRQSVNKEHDEENEETKLDRKTLSIAIRFLRAKTPEQRAAVDLDTHYTKEYVKGISASGMQSNSGFDGQVHACWKHKMAQTEIEQIRTAGFPVSVIHGRDDVIAQICYARRLAEKLHPVARMVELHGGHLVSHERPQEVNQALIELIKASESKISPNDWTNLPNKNSGMSFGRTSTEQRSYMIKILEKLQFCLLYLFGLFVMAFQNSRRLLQYLKPVRVRASLTQSYDLEVDFESDENASIVYAALAVDKELQPDKVKRQMSVANGKLSVHFEAVEARFLRASFSAFVDVLTLATKTIEQFGQGMKL
ncbi:hypothetical protein JRO89_XS15G0025600 [Xanthoceras sorbifolium]|uniref:AB hydrolase-1 domain-containing protein n=1 Tax=Xanthoceras sorbifolium TaxID=99658 RepID=A0ABQ8H0V6_9ROSI|nr:hypothetical protein JRO89_XS15G0025600 [Xanthoceras sorbifolium]